MENLKNIFFALIIISLSFFTYMDTSSDFVFTNSVKSNHEEKQVSITVDNGFPGKEIANDFFNQKNKNKNTIGYMLVPEIGYYPIMYSGDNKFYLNHDSSDKYYAGGSIFMNKFSQGNFESMALIHGHKMRNSTMFGSLGKFESEEFFRKNPPIEVFDGEYLYFYKPFTVLYVQDGKEFINQEKSFPGREAYFQGLYNRSIVEMQEGIVPDFGEQMLFLSTCYYDYDDPTRLVVGSYLIKKIPYSANPNEKIILNAANEIYNLYAEENFKKESENV